MIKILPKIFLLKSFRLFGFPKVLPINYTFLISTQCNARCKTCKIWQQKHDELKLNEWEKIIKSLGHSPFWITISGGEPFLQPHLVRFCQLIFSICQPAILTIPTNGLLSKTIVNKTDSILKLAKKTKVVINLSLDGVGQKHDNIRGVKGNFVAFEKTFQKLKKLKKKCPYLTIGVHSVISKFNVNEVDELFDYVFSLEPDQYITEIAEERVELNTISLNITPSYQEYSKAISGLIKHVKTPPRWPNACLPARQGLLGGGGKRQLITKITQAFRLEYYQFVKKWLKGEKIKTKDYAGWASCEISSWGEVWPSCIHGINFGNLREANYNFSEVWFGKKAQKFRKEYQNKPESFPLANAFYTNVIFELKTMAKVIYKIYLSTS